LAISGLHFVQFASSRMPKSGAVLCCLLLLLEKDYACLFCV
jgi:hypothetical protein